LVTPRSASRNATGLEAIDEPLSAWMVKTSRSMPPVALYAAAGLFLLILLIGTGGRPQPGERAEGVPRYLDRDRSAHPVGAGGAAVPARCEH
jgi:hypothetical protein